MLKFAEKLWLFCELIRAFAYAIIFNWGNDAAPLKTDARLELSTHKGNINNRLEQC